MGKIREGLINQQPALKGFMEERIAEIEEGAGEFYVDIEKGLMFAHFGSTYIDGVNRVLSLIDRLYEDNVLAVWDRINQAQEFALNRMEMYSALGDYEASRAMHNTCNEVVASNRAAIEQGELEINALCAETIHHALVPFVRYPAAFQHNIEQRYAIYILMHRYLVILEGQDEPKSPGMRQSEARYNKLYGQLCRAEWNAWKETHAHEVEKITREIKETEALGDKIVDQRKAVVDELDAVMAEAERHPEHKKRQITDKIVSKENELKKLSVFKRKLKREIQGNILELRNELSALNYVEASSMRNYEDIETEISRLKSKISELDKQEELSSEKLKRLKTRLDRPIEIDVRKETVKLEKEREGIEKEAQRIMNILMNEN